MPCPVLVLWQVPVVVVIDVCQCCCSSLGSVAARGGAIVWFLIMGSQLLYRYIRERENTLMPNIALHNKSGGTIK